MSTTADTAIRNGVDTTVLFGTLDAIKADPSLATFRFRARNRWIDGSHNRTTIRDFYAANQEDTSRTAPFVVDAQRRCGDLSPGVHLERQAGGCEQRRRNSAPTTRQRFWIAPIW